MTAQEHGAQNFHLDEKLVFPEKLDAISEFDSYFFKLSPAVQ